MVGDTDCVEGLVFVGVAVDGVGVVVVVSFDFKACFGLPASSAVPTATPPAPWDRGPSFRALSFSPMLPPAGISWVWTCGLAAL